MNDHVSWLRIIYRITRDLLLICCSAVVHIVFQVSINHLDLWNKTGFYCSDQDLWYPYKKSSVSTNVLLWYINTLIPFIVFTIVEGNWNNGGVIRIYRFNVPLWIPQIYNRMVQYVFGFYLQMSFMLIPKFFDAPHFLRPHFMAVCQPIIGPKNLTCKEIENPNLFIMDYVCKSDPNFTTAQVRNIYWTFPSGHSSCSFYTAVYLVLYLQNRVRARKVNELKLIVQFILIFMAIGVSITRLQDHHHHGVDVFFGASLGIGIATFVYTFLSKLFPIIRDVTGFTNHGVETGIGIHEQQQPK